MKYDKDYAKKVFELISEANFVGVDYNGRAFWDEGKPTLTKRSGWWPSTGDTLCGGLDEVECDDWRESLISREEVGL